MLQETLNESFNELGFKLYKSKPTGNCFFSSLSKYFRLSGCPHGDSKTMRLSLIKYIKQNSDIFEYIQNTLGMSSQEIDDDLYDLRQSGVYDVDIFDVLPVIVATQYDIKVCIYTWMSETPYISESDCEVYVPINFKDKNKISSIHLLYTDLEHYDLLYKT